MSREAFEKVLEGALNDAKFEADLRLTHRLALRRIQAPDAKCRPEFQAWKKQERNAWLLVRALNERIALCRLDIVDLDEEIDLLERLFKADT